MEDNSTDKRIRFESKEESNARRIREALERKPEERLRFFLEMIEELSEIYPLKAKNNSENFILRKDGKF